MGSLFAQSRDIDSHFHQVWVRVGQRPGTPKLGRQTAAEASGRPGRPAFGADPSRKPREGKRDTVLLLPFPGFGGGALAPLGSRSPDERLMVNGSFVACGFQKGPSRPSGKPHSETVSLSHLLPVPLPIPVVPLPSFLPPDPRGSTRPWATPLQHLLSGQENKHRPPARD